MVKKAALVQNLLLFTVEAFAKLTDDENFTTLLRAETLDDMPKFLADRIDERAVR